MTGKTKQTFIHSARSIHSSKAGEWLVVDQQKAWEKERCIKGDFNKDYLVSPEYNRFFFSLKRASLVKERVLRSERTHFNPKKQDEDLFLSIRNYVCLGSVNTEYCLVPRPVVLTTF